MSPIRVSSAQAGAQNESRHVPQNSTEERP